GSPYPIDCASSYDRLDARVLPVVAADLRGGHAVPDDDVAGEVVGAADERRADTVRIDRDALPLEARDLLCREATRGDDAHLLVARRIERVADLPDETLVHTRRIEVAELAEERAVDQGVRRVEAPAPTPFGESVTDCE